MGIDMACISNKEETTHVDCSVDRADQRIRLLCCCLHFAQRT